MDGKKYIRYIHGSEDSTDLDVYYVFDEIPDIVECRKFCNADPSENRNIICIQNGIVTDCFIGTADEINNALMYTYSLHKQEYPLLVDRFVERDITVKSIRAVRGILSLLSRTKHRKIIKNALNSGFSERINALKQIDFTNIDYENLGKRLNKKDVLKVIAFQLGQTIGLYENYELYTKSKISEKYPELKQFLYRYDDTNLNILNTYIEKLIKYLEKIKVEENERNCYFTEEKRTIDLKTETIL